MVYYELHRHKNGDAFEALFIYLKDICSNIIL